jgi:hypothetical protein
MEMYERDSTKDSIEIAFLTGRVVQFIDNVARNAGIAPDLLAKRVSEQLGDSEMRQVPGVTKVVSPLSQRRTSAHTSARKVAVARRTPSKLSGQRLRHAREMLARGSSVNAVAKKYHVSWLKAKDLRKAA